MSSDNTTVVSNSEGGYSDNPYGYVPSRAIAIVFLSLFLTSTLIHAWQAKHYRKWWLLYTACVGGIIELAGWSGRLWSSFSPLLDSPFQMQITCTIIAPTPLLAASFVIFGGVIGILGPQYSRLSPKWYTIIFSSCDVVSLVVQGVGGGLAASSDTPDGADMGAHIMLGGIAFQLAIIVLFGACAIEFFYRYFNNMAFPQAELRFRRSTIRAGFGTGRGELTMNVRWMCFALVFSTTCFFIRSIYRIIELTDGWNGRIIQTQVYFNVLDGAMIVLAFYTINIFHPGRFLSTKGMEKEAEMESLSA